MLIILSAIMLLFLLVDAPCNAETVASGECGIEGNNVIWTLDDMGKLVISGTGAMKTYNNGATAEYKEYADIIKEVIIKKELQQLVRRLLEISLFQM